MKLVKLSLAEIVPPANPIRAQFDEVKLNDLAANIRVNGLVVPIGVKKIATGYEVIHGHRRLLACRIAGLVAIPCILRTTEEASDEAWKANENLYREELSPAEEAAYFAELMEGLGNDVDALCAHIGQKRDYVEGRLNLLAGDTDVLKALVDKQITLGAAQWLNKCKRESDRKYLLHFACKDGATVHTVATWVQTYNARPDTVVVEGDAGLPQPAPAAPAPNPMKCWICGTSEEPWDLRIVYEHSACRRVLDRQAGVAQMEAAKDTV